MWECFSVIGEGKMKPHKIAAIALAGLLITGCKTSVETEVKLSDLLTSESKAIPGNLYVEVAGCNDFQDSRKPSDTLVKTQEQIPSIFADAKYVECFRQKMDSLAHFTVPIYLDKDKDGKLASDSHINIVSNDKNLLSVEVPQKIKASLDNVSKNSLIASVLKLSFSIKVINDTEKTFPFTVMAAYVEDQPYVFANLTSNAGSPFVVKLSDVSVSSALESGSARVLAHAAQ